MIDDQRAARAVEDDPGGWADAFAEPDIFLLDHVIGAGRERLALAAELSVIFDEGFLIPLDEVPEAIGEAGLGFGGGKIFNFEEAIGAAKNVLWSHAGHADQGAEDQAVFIEDDGGFFGE